MPPHQRQKPVHSPRGVKAMAVQESIGCMELVIKMMCLNVGVDGLITGN